MERRRFGRAASGLVAILVGAAAWLVPVSPAMAAPGTVTADRSSMDFGSLRVGTLSETETVTFTFTGGDGTTVTDVSVTGPHAADYSSFWGTNCLGDSGEDQTFQDGDTCDVSVALVPFDRGNRTATVTLTSDSPSSPNQVGLSATGTVGYYITSTEGAVANFGDAEDFGDLSDEDLLAPIVGIATTPNGGGFWLASEDGGVFAFGNAGYHGSMGGKRLNAPIVGIAASPDGFGYWLVASDGGIFAFGSVDFHGSMGGKPLNEPMVGIASTPTGNGYWTVALDGGIFSFGDADFFQSMGGKPLNEPMVAMEASPSGQGYHTVATDGGIFSFGDAKFKGSMGGQPLNLPMIDMAEYPTGNGYWTVAVDGGVFAFGDAPFQGSLGKVGVNDIVGIAGTAPPVDLAAFQAGAAGSHSMAAFKRATAAHGQAG